MIINFSVKNYRSIKDKITLSFEATNSKNLEEYYIVEPKKGLRLLKLGIIYGANASGKTNLLRALDFLRNLILNPNEKKTDELDVEPFLFNKKTQNEDTVFSLEFIQNKIKYLYEIQLNKKAIVKEILYFHKPNKAILFERTTNIQKQLTKIVFGNKVKIKKESRIAIEGNTLWNNTVLGGYLKTNFDSLELQEVIDWFKYNLSPVVYAKADIYEFISDQIEEKKLNKNNILRILQKADLGISDILIENEKIDVDEELLKYISKNMDISKKEIADIKKKGKVEIKKLLFQHRINNNIFSLPFSDESEGTKRYYELGGLLSMIINNPMVLPIDELESSLHPDLIKHFLLTFLVNSKKSQLIGTTHFRELLTEKDILRNDIIWFTEKKEDGSTDLFSLSDFHSSVIRDTSSIYNAYKIGKLGATPNLNDYYLGLDNEEK